MKKVIIYLAVIILSLLSCNVQKIEHKTICGTFYGLQKGTDFKTSYMLKLRLDSKFFLKVGTAAGTPQCKGKWKILENEYILLECCKIKDISEVLTNGYMGQRVHKLQIINNNKIRYSDVVLKRKKDK